MADDIVTRLRLPVSGNYDDEKFSEGPQPCSMCVEAADEIERLRGELDKWKKVARERNPHSWANLVRKMYGMEDMYD